MKERWRKNYLYEKYFPFHLSTPYGTSGCILFLRLSTKKWPLEFLVHKILHQREPMLGLLAYLQFSAKESVPVKEHPKYLIYCSC